MTADDGNKSQKGVPATGGESAAGLVKRSEVPPGKPYTDYRENLRRDFFCQCGYCTTSEAEAEASVRPELRDVYSNLMYCCDECNILKGDRCPTPAARAKGFRFFRPDEDLRRDHLKLTGEEVEPKSDVGKFTIVMLSLNRLSLRRIRRLRERILNCNAFVSDGMVSLLSFKLDQLPSEIRLRAKRNIEIMTRVADRFEENIETILRAAASSLLIGEDPDASRQASERASMAREMESLFPGRWRALRKTQPSKRRDKRGRTS